jgi:SanA protein
MLNRVIGMRLRSSLARARLALGDPTTRRRLKRGTAGALLGLFVVGWLMSLRVGAASRGRVFEVADAPPREVAIVFGAGVRPDGSLGAPLADRVLTAVQLYRAGKVRKLLMSGDNGSASYNEPQAMMEYAVAHGVPRSDVVLDFAGFHTYDTCYRAQAVFDVRRAVLVTQRYHLARSIFTCQALGIDVVGVAADRQLYRRRVWYRMREQVSRVVAFVRVRITHPRPRFVSPKVPIG